MVVRVQKKVRGERKTAEKRERKARWWWWWKTNAQQRVREVHAGARACSRQVREMRGRNARVNACARANARTNAVRGARRTNGNVNVRERNVNAERARGVQSKTRTEPQNVNACEPCACAAVR